MAWLDIARGAQRIIIALALTGVVCWRAIMGDDWAVGVVATAMPLIIGALWGERSRSKADG